MSWSRVIGIKETKHQVKIAVDAPKSIRFMVIQIDRPSEEPSYRLFVPHSFDEQKKMFTGWAIVARNPYIIESCGYHTAFVVGNWSPSGRSYGFSKDDTVALYANIDESKLTDISYILE